MYWSFNWLKVMRASTNYAILFKQSKKNIFIFNIKNNVTTWNNMKYNSTFFLIEYICCTPIKFNSLGWVIIPPSFWWPQFCASQKRRSRRPRVWSRMEIHHFTRESFNETNWNIKLLISFVSYYPVDDITLGASFRVNCGYCTSVA